MVENLIQINAPIKTENSTVSTDEKYTVSLRSLPQHSLAVIGYAWLYTHCVLFSLQVFSTIH